MSCLDGSCGTIPMIHQLLESRECGAKIHSNVKYYLFCIVNPLVSVN